MEFSEVLQSRYSVRSFAKRTVEQEKISAILRAAQIAPTAKNLQPFKIRVVEGEELAKLSKATKCGYGAPLAFIVCADGEPYKRFYDGKNSYDVDASIVTTYMMLQARALGLGTCWVMAFQPAVLKEEFPVLAEPIAILVCGYPAEDSVPAERHTQRKPLSELLYDEKNR